MTVLEAIKSVASYPLSEPAMRLILIRRGLDEAQEVDQQLLQGKAFELATADAYLHLTTSANVQEGDYSLSITDKSNFLKMASSLYRKWGEPDLTEPAPNVRDLSSIW